MYSVHTVVHAADMYYGAIWNYKNGHVERLCFVKEDANGLRWMEKTCDEESWQKSNENMLDLFRVWVRLHQLFFNQKIIMYCVLRCASIPRVMATENYTQWRRSLLHDDERNGARSIMQPESTADEGRTSSHPPTFRPRFVHDRWISSPIYTDWSSSSSSSSFDLFTLICPLFSFFFSSPFARCFVFEPAITAKEEGWDAWKEFPASADAQPSVEKTLGWEIRFQSTKLASSLATTSRLLLLLLLFHTILARARRWMTCLS